MFKQIAEFEIDPTVNSDVLMAEIHAACMNSQAYAIRKVKRSPNKMQFQVTTGNWLLVNSFLPWVTVTRRGGENGTSVSFECRLSYAVQAGLVVYGLLAVIFEVLMLWSVFFGTMTPSLLLGLPIGIALFMLVVSYVGFKLSAKAFLRGLLGSLGWA